jgi:signal transduction histidine kinase
MSRFSLALLGLCTFVAAPAAIAGSPQPVARVVRQYAITSANDFPQRDPSDWRLLGSNDDGKTWTALDVRKGELFSERHQRRVFKLANPGSYRSYRLRIDRVQNPAAADCVQLAELEPLGETEDDLGPAPLLEDLITAQDDNSPWETRFHAFDGRVETKWLDHAATNAATRASWIQWQYTSPPDLFITNLNHLFGLRNRAARAYPVRIEGVVVGRMPGTNAWCVFDGTGSLAIPEAGAPEPLRPGQPVLVEGRSWWTNGLVEITERRLRVLGKAVQAGPRRIALEQPLAPGENLQWVEAEGSVVFSASAEGQILLELEDNQQTLAVRVLHSVEGKRPPLAGERVRVQGICEALLNSQGERVAGTLWVPSLDAIQPVTSANERTYPPEHAHAAIPANGPAPLLTSIEQIRRLRPEDLVRRPPVKVRGVVTELFGAYLQEGATGVEIWYAASAGLKAPEFCSCVEIEGRGDWAKGHGPIVRAEKVLVLGNGKLPRPDRCTWSEMAGGRMVDEWVEIEAVVRSTDGSHLLLNSEGGPLMATIRAAPAPLVKQLVDATVRVRGVCAAATDSGGRMQGIQLIVPSLESVEVVQSPPDPASLPIRSIGSLLQVRGPKEFSHRVKVQGMLTFQEGGNYFVQDATGATMAIAQEEVILSTPADGWSWLFRQSAGLSPAPQNEPQLRAGDHLQVVGFPEMRGYSPILTEVQVRKASGSNTVVPVKASVEDIAGGALDATLVSLEAVFLGQQTLGIHYVLDLQSSQHTFQAFVPTAGNPAPAVAPGSKVRLTGVCQVEPVLYTGLGRRVASFRLLAGSPECLAVLERPPWWTLKRALVAAGALLVVLTIALGWIALLRRQVEERTKQLQQEIAQHEQTEARLAEETRRVHAEIEERKRMEAEVERGHRQLLKASRLAGMAEVATSVLHNVGNVLNSANVLGSSIMEQVQRSKAPSVGRLAALLGEHRATLSQFVAEDERGRHLPGYLERLGCHLAQEQEQLLGKTKSLTESLQHIKEIVAMQQNYARVSGVLETVPPAEIVEDALRLHHEAMARHQIQVVRDFQPMPPVTIDRHKVLQILFNLLENARYACEDGGQPEKRVTVSLRQAGHPSAEHCSAGNAGTPDGQSNALRSGDNASLPHNGRIQVAVADNGIGIPPENMARIFAQEFSTRKGGHGFGLHSSLLAAQDMGGSLKAHSDGAGCGATFVLEVPLAPPAASRLTSDAPG